MQTFLPPDAPPDAPTDLPPPDLGPGDDGRKAGATWVAATGAFLLLAAAAVFIAVQWRSLPEAAKLALVGALTGGFLAGGRALKRTLPGTGDVLFHLGAFLVPVDVAGLCIRLEVDWRTTVLAEGIVGTAALGAFAATTGSVVLRWGAAVSVVTLVLGIAALTPLPAPLLLAVAAVAAHLLGQRRLAIAWAAIAGVAPVIGAGVAGTLAVAAGRELGAGTLAELGLAGSSAALFAIASGVMSAGVLWREAHRTRDLAIVALGAISLVSGAATTWVATDPSFEANLLAAPAMFVLVQIAALLTMRDAFWRRPARWLALGAEALAALAAPVAGVFILLAPIVEEGLDFFGDSPGWSPDHPGALAWLTLAAGWLIAAWRRQSPKDTVVAAVRAAVGDDRTVVFLATALGAALVIGTASTALIAAGLVVMAGLLVVTGGILATLLSVPAIAWATVTIGFEHPLAVLPVALVGAGVLTFGALRWSGRGGSIPTVLLTASASLLVVSAAGFAAESSDLGVTAAALVAVFAAWGMAVAVERASTIAAFVARAPMAIAAFSALAGTDLEALPVALAATLLFAVEAIRTDDPRSGIGAAFTAPLAVIAAAGASGMAMAETGVALAVFGAVLAGLALLAPDRWRLPVLATAASSLAVGLPLAADDPVRFAETIILSGGLLVAAGLTLRQSVLAHVGGVVATIGVALHLIADGVTATEPFLLPVAIQLAVAGWQLRRRTEDNISSWIAFGPSIGLLGSAAVFERIDGGDAWHALIAGAVGVVAVALGGWKRLAGPLFLGTALVVTVTVLESLHTLAGVPTWAWLAAGGATLLATGIALERAATSPAEAGRRLVDVVAERFD